MSRARHATYLALRYLASSPGRTAVLVLGLAVAWFLPAFTVQVGHLAEARLLQRATDTPVVLGHVGNEFDLVMSSLYFRGDVSDPLPFGAVAEAARDGLAVPMHLGFTAGGAPVVGTSLDYYAARRLTLSQGRLPAVLGEVVVGAEVAQAAHLAPGDDLRSDQKNLYNLAGAYPLLLRVVGVLETTGGPDDLAVFADIKTTWVLAGLLHGHEAVTAGNAAGGDDDNLEASLALFLFTEITPETLPSFHLHGGAEDWPVSSVLVWPRDAKAHDQLLGDAAVHPTRQAVRPVTVVRTILGIVMRVQELLATWVVLVGLSTAAFVGLVVSLSLRLRSSEMQLLKRIGAGRATIAAMLGVEAGLVIALSLGLAACLTWGATAWLVASLGL